MPTVIYKDANEAIDLNKQSPEIRPYLKKIFLEKHPSAVALHAMDSGNFSLTLGYTKISTHGITVPPPQTGVGGNVAVFSGRVPFSQVPYPPMRRNDKYKFKCSL